MKMRWPVLLLVVFAASSANAGEFDQHVKACHDAVWARDEFKEIPNVGVSAYLGRIRR